ncbi:MAG: family 43 glycosylhydrolase [Armatimonadota bacterium]|jgi:beta-xylosidase|nr:family 43 glycosylhydrolase [Acidobacteriota bacterium]
MMTTALALLAATLAAQLDEAPTMVRTEDIHMRDPWIMPHEDRYVLIGTTGDAWGVEGGGFAVFTSTDLREWTPHGQALELDDPPTWAAYQFWAPEMVERNGRFYLFYSGNSDHTRRGTGVATADGPLGPFRNLSNRPITPLEWECLDGHLFRDLDGAEYLIYVHEWVQCTIGEMWIQPIAEDYTALVGESTLLFKGGDAAWSNEVIDGPMMVVRDGRYHLFWSSFNPHTTEGGAYCVGVATSDSLLGPYVQSETPLVVGDGGHNCVFEGPEGRLYTCFHAPNRSPDERVRIHELLYEHGAWRLGPAVE